MTESENPDGLPLTEEDLVERFVPELARALGDEQALRLTLARYRKAGAHLGNQLLIDVLCISENMLERAGFDDAQARAAMELYDSLTRDELERA